MTQHVITVQLTTPLKDVARILVESGISGLPVVDELGHVVGVVSEADFLIKERGRDGLHRRPLARIIGPSEADEAELAKVEALTAAGAMSRPVVSVGPDLPIAEAAQLMIERRINRLPVITASGQLVGIVTRADIVRAFIRPDEELARTIRDNVIIGTMWLDPIDVKVSVDHGVVRLRGTLDRRSSAQILRRLVGQVDGVVGVDADLEWRLDDEGIEAPEKDLVWPRSQPG